MCNEQPLAYGQSDNVKSFVELNHDGIGIELQANIQFTHEAPCRPYRICGANSTE